MRIRSKAILIFLSLSLVPLAVFGWLAYTNGEETIRKNLGLSLQQIAHETIDKVDRGLYEVYQNVQIWAGLDVMQEVLTKDVDARISTFLIGLNEQYGSFASLLVANQAGEVVAANDPELIGLPVQIEPFFREAMERAPYLGDVQRDARSKTWVVTVAFPIQAKFGADQLIGVLCANWKADELIKMIQPPVAEDRAPQDGHVLLMRGDGLVIAASDFAKADVFTRNLLDAGLQSARLASQQRHGYLIERDERGIPSIIGYDPSIGYRDFPGLSWAALVVQDVRSAFAPIERLKLIIITIGVLTACGVMVLSLLIAQRMTAPILKISQVAGRVAQGDFEGQVVSASDDEIGSLARAFNQMVQDLKRQRAQLVEKEYVENIIGSMSDMLIVVDPGAIIRRVNRATCALLGYQPADLVGQPMAKVFADVSPFKDAGVDAFTGFVEALRSKGAVRNVEAVFISKDGRRLPVLFSSSVMRHQRGKWQGIVCVAQDITERKHAEETLKRYAAKLARSNAELEQLAYVASHDLQEPLRMVASYTQLLARRYKGKLDADADDFIKFAVDAATRMQRLIQDLLEYARVAQRGKPFAPTDCSALLEEALSNLQLAIEESHAVVTRDALPTVTADASQLGRVFQNLIGNAIKFRRKDEPPAIHVGAERNGQEWRFSVRDNGIGIDPKHIGRLFAIFHRLHTEREYPGTGIGLAMSKTIVERHRGRMWVESEPNKGTTFYFTIPMDLPQGGTAHEQTH